MCACTEHEFTVQISYEPRLYDMHRYVAHKEDILHVSLLMFTARFAAVGHEGSPIVKAVNQEPSHKPWVSEFRL